MFPYFNNPFSFYYNTKNMQKDFVQKNKNKYNDIDDDIYKKNPNSNKPILSNNPIQTSIVLFKELTGYPNYGNPSNNADILYTGNRGVWTFDTGAFGMVSNKMRAQVIIRASLDDHSNVPTNRYSATIEINGSAVHTGPLPLTHGSPEGQKFKNWKSLKFNISNLRQNNRIVITNTSNANQNDWIAFDWIEIRLIPI